MRNKFWRAAVCAGLIAGLAPATRLPAQAIPLFAQRYRLRCEACHSVLPELNEFGVAFRERGYRLPLPKHGTAGRGAFGDRYQRLGLYAHARLNAIDVQAEQWWGSDANADGFGAQTPRSGGHLRLKYYPTPHAYARLLFQQFSPVGGKPQFGAALTVGFPWPANL